MLKRCQSGGKPGYKWKDSGRCYTYTPGNAISRERAKLKAAAQGVAAQAKEKKKK